MQSVRDLSATLWLPSVLLRVRRCRLISWARLYHLLQALAKSARGAIGLRAASSLTGSRPSTTMPYVSFRLPSLSSRESGGIIALSEWAMPLGERAEVWALYG